jgi:SAM-dependent methyltransferase
MNTMTIMNSNAYDQQAHWDELHLLYSGPEHNAEAPGAFAQYFGTWLTEQGLHGRLLELGCGGGADYCHFSRLGWNAVGLDFSREGLRSAGRKLGESARLVQQHLPQGLPFADGTFTTVFAHLSLHYFDDKITSFIFSEIHRVIGLNGNFALRVKSVENKACGRGERIGRDIYMYHGHLRHFFRRAFLDELIAQHPWRRLDDWQEEEPGYLSAVWKKMK